MDRHLMLETDIGMSYVIACGESYGLAKEILVTYMPEHVDCPACLNLMNNQN